MASVLGIEGLRVGWTHLQRDKFAVRAIAEGARIEHRADNIRCTIISPGAVDTDLPEGRSEEATRQHLREFYEVAVPPVSVARAIADAIEQPATVEISSSWFG